jgi:hypothetical protein
VSLSDGAASGRSIPARPRGHLGAEDGCRRRRGQVDAREQAPERHPALPGLADRGVEASVDHVTALSNVSVKSCDLVGLSCSGRQQRLLTPIKLDVLGQVGTNRFLERLAGGWLLGRHAATASIGFL